MKKKYIFLIVALILIFVFVLRFIPQKEKVEKITILSPVPNFLSLPNNNQVSTINLWLPAITDFLFGNDSPQVSAESALVYDITANKALYEKNIKQKLPMASLTKIMTAIIALENKKQSNKYLVKADDLVGENSMGLSQGEVLSLEDLLYGLLLPSGNDAAEVIASNFNGGRIAFIKAMNLKAKSMGLNTTIFTNPSGLEGDGDQHTTAYDLLVITRYALENFPLFRKIVSTYEYTIEKTDFHKEFYILNETNLLTSYPGVKGVKTGYTPEAGLCLITYLDYKDHKLIGIILGSNNRRQEMKDLLDYSLNKIGITPPKHQ